MFAAALTRFECGPMLPLQRPVTNVSPEPIHACCPMPAAIAIQSCPTQADAALRIDRANAVAAGWLGAAPDARSWRQDLPLIAAGNHLMARLPGAGRQRLLTLCERVSLPLMERLYETGQANRHLWFPESACISLVSQVPGHGGLEVAMVGREGLLGAELALGSEHASTLAVVQGAGSAWRVANAPLLLELGRSPALRHSINGYLHVLMSQFATACACQRFHRIGPRLARWLLVRHDRAEGQPFHVTHECLASMLGVRRVGVTVAAGQLQAHGLIRYHRGEVVVLDRSRLEARTCSCYAADRAAYRTQLGP